MGSSAKAGKFFIGGSQEHFLGQKHKSTICDRTPPNLHIKPSLYMCRRVQGSQIFKQNWIISIHSRVIVILLIWVSSALEGGAGAWGVSGVINYSLYELRNVCTCMHVGTPPITPDTPTCLLPRATGSPKHQNSISPELIKIIWFCFKILYLGGGVSLHTCTCMCMHAHVYMYRNCKWPLTWRHPCLSCLTSMCMHVCVCMHTCMGHPHTPIPGPTPSTHLPPPMGDPWNQLKFDNTWTNQDISIPFKDLKSVKNWVWFGGWVGWAGWWVGSGQNTKIFKNVDWIKIIHFCLKIYDL